MSARRSVHVEGLGHGGLPIPAASRVGNLIATGGVRGVDPATGVVPDSVAEQVRLMFANLRSIVEAAGGSLDTIVKVTVYANDRSVRKDVDPVWVELFPDEASRPARHLLAVELPPGMSIQCDALALAGEV